MEQQQKKVDDTFNRLEEGIDQTAKRAENIVKGVEQISSDVRQDYSEIRREIRNEIELMQRNPLALVVAALMVGFTLGQLYRESKRSSAPSPGDFAA